MCNTITKLIRKHKVAQNTAYEAPMSPQEAVEAYEARYGMLFYANATVGVYSYEWTCWVKHEDALRLKMRLVMNAEPDEMFLLKVTSWLMVNRPWNKKKFDAAVAAFEASRNRGSYDPMAGEDND